MKEQSKINTINMEINVINNIGISVELKKKKKTKCYLGRHLIN
jgi:hypothetical protein